MKKLIFIGIMSMGLASAMAQTGKGNDESNSFKNEMDDFRADMHKEFKDFRKQCFAEYISFVRKAWKEVGVERPIPLPKDEEFVPEIAVLNDETNSWLLKQLGHMKDKIFGGYKKKQAMREENRMKQQNADAMPENLKGEDDKQVAQNMQPGKDEKSMEVVINKLILAKPEPYVQPQPLAPVEEDLASRNDEFAFTSFGTEYKVRIGENCKFKLREVESDAIADALENMFQTQYDNLLYDCLELRKEHHLSDWAYYQMLCSLVDSFYGPNSNEGTLVLAYLYMQSGYKMRMAHNHENIFMLIASQHIIYGKPSYRLDGERFYVIKGSEPSSMSICEAKFEKESSLSLIIPESQDFAMNAANSRTISSSRYPDFSFTVSINRNLMDFYETYPTSQLGTDHMSRWAMYANAPMVDEVTSQLYPQMRNKLQGLSKLDAVRRLLNWVQMGLDYQYDNNVWGHDRAFFGEESLYYPYCDCEDRAILLSHLVRDLLGLDAILVYYPGHLAMAVGFDEPVEGDYIMLDGRRFVVCDPTYLGADVGETMRGMDNRSADVILLEKSI